MVRCAQLGAAGAAARAIKSPVQPGPVSLVFPRRLLCLVLATAIAGFCFPRSTEAQETGVQRTDTQAQRRAAAQAALTSEHWEDAARMAKGPAEQAAELDYIAGLALAKLGRWEEARSAFDAGRAKAPADARFPTELAGVAYKQGDFALAKSDLRAALRLAPADSYTREFLGTLYFLDGNLPAALKYWNAAGKPRLGAVVFSPEPKLESAILQQAVPFNAPQVLTGDALRESDARLNLLGIFPARRVELVPAGGDAFDATLHLAERNGFGDSWLAGLLSALSGVGYDTIYPEFYNLRGEALNFASMARWDAQKRRFGGEISAPLWHDPTKRARIFFDARNENWNLARTFFEPNLPVTDLNLRRFAGGLRFESLVNANWSWSAGIEAASREFRNLPAAAKPADGRFFASTTSLAVSLGVKRSLLQIPELRFALEGAAEARAGRYFAMNSGAFASLRVATNATWFPSARGDDFAMRLQLRAGATAGAATLDDLFELGLERDNDLWLRGHPGTTGGRKGAAPLGRRFFLANWEMDKNVYNNGFLGVTLGPFLDSGVIADSSGLFGSRGWQVDTGAQCKLRVLHGVTVTLIYGRDLRGARNLFFPAATP